MSGSETVCPAALAAASERKRKARVSGVSHFGYGVLQAQDDAAGRSDVSGSQIFPVLRN